MDPGRVTQRDRKTCDDFSLLFVNHGFSAWWMPCPPAEFVLDGHSGVSCTTENDGRVHHGAWIDQKSIIRCLLIDVYITLREWNADPGLLELLLHRMHQVPVDGPVVFGESPWSANQVH